MAEEYTTLELPTIPGAQRGITYLVSSKNVIIFTREYTKHMLLYLRSGIPREEIMWGGILSKSGLWVRKSLDFGDAPDETMRNEVVKILCNKLLLSPENDGQSIF